RLESQPELLFKSVRQREGAARVRCRQRAARRRAGARVSAPALSASLKLADGAEINHQVPGAVDSGRILNGSMNISGRKALKPVGELRHGDVLTSHQP